MDATDMVLAAAAAGGTTTTAHIKALLDDPEGFMRDVMHLELTSWQIEVLRTSMPMVTLRAHVGGLPRTFPR